MPLAKLCAAAALATCAASLTLSSRDSNATAAPAPEWCKPEEELTPAQRKARVKAEAKLDWAKKEVVILRAKGETVPDWMDEMVARSERAGKQKWAAAEAKRLKDEGQEVPSWIADDAKEAQKGANRWAACKVAEMRANNEEVPAWLADNARQGIMESANEKIKDIQEEIHELESEKDEETSKVEAEGDMAVAEERKLARTKESRRVTVENQGRMVADALARMKDLLPGDLDERKQALKDAADATRALLKSLEGRLVMA